MSKELTQEEKDAIAQKAQAFQDAYLTLCREHGFHHRAVWRSTESAFICTQTIVPLPPDPQPI